jgi:sialate O-acetylesterase
MWRLFLTGLLATVAAHSFAVLRMSSLFGDNMVLQAGKRTPIYGRATPREIIQIRLGKHNARAMANERGDWRIEMDLDRQQGPLELEISGASSKLTFKNVLIGEVWICSGQSNMEWSYHDAKSANQPIDIGNPDRANLRLFQVKRTIAIVPLRDPQGKWVVCNRQTMNDFSLLGYFFGTNLQDRLSCGVGVIEADWGGTPAEAWTPHSTLVASPELHSLIDSNFPVPTGAGHETNEPHKPERATSVLYNGMIAPLMPYGFRGATWYQGESNIGRASQYKSLFPAMINSWRRECGRPFPFLFVQLGAFGPRSTDPAPSEWAEMREAQMAGLKLPCSGMATAVDLSHPVEIHWMQRDILAKRLTWAAMGTVYGRRAPVTGPIYRGHRVDGGEIRLDFDGKLNGLAILRGNGLCGFEIAGEDRIFRRALARIHGAAVVVSSPRVPHPVAVRYAWGNSPDISLYNSAGLPAIPFRTDDWPN